MYKKDGKELRPKNNIHVPKFDPCDPEPLLSEKDGELLRQVWANLKDDIHKVGVITFVRQVLTFIYLVGAFIQRRTVRISMSVNVNCPTSSSRMFIETIFKTKLTQLLSAAKPGTNSLSFN